MKRFVLASVLLLALSAAVLAADRFEDKGLGISVAPPAGFQKSDEKPPVPDAVGDVKAYFAPKESRPGAWVLVHSMEIPENMEFGAFKAGLSDGLSNHFGDGYKLVKQEDLDIPKLTGFVLDFVAPGDGKFPQAGGTTPHHIRWYLLKGENGRATGLIYAATEADWKDLEPKYSESAKSLKAVEN